MFHTSASGKTSVSAAHIEEPILHITYTVDM